MPRIFAIATVLALATPALPQSYTCSSPNTTLAFTNSSPVGTTGGSIQSIAVPSSQVTIDALGAQGGSAGGLGAEVVATFAITPGQTLCVLVGAQGGSAVNGAGGGGGGSFVYAISEGTCASNLPSVTTGVPPNLLVAAAGGGGTSSGGESGLGGRVPNGAGGGGASFGGIGSDFGGAGGTGGSGGAAVVNSGGGGGLFTDGGAANGVPGGQAFVSGAAGGAYPSFANGGYGGGGAAAATGGGGGGYNGGGGGGTAGLIGAGGGGGSFSATVPLLPYTRSGVRPANGLVTLCYVDEATHFTVSAPASATAGTPSSFTVTALDALDNTATGYTGTVHFTSTDGAATLPADSTLTNGVGTFPVTLRTAGSQTITATDTVTSSISGTSGAIAVSVIAGSIHLLGTGACPSGSNWSTAACWDLNRAPATGDDVAISGAAQASTNYDLGAGVLLHSLTIGSASGAVTVTGGAIGLQSGGAVTDSFNNGAADTLPGIVLNGPATFTVSSAGETLRIAGAIGGAFGLTKAGSGVLLLAGTNTYTGGTTAGGGTLNVTGSLGSSAVTVGAGATLTGTGTVLSIAVQSGGGVSGNLTATNGATFAAGSFFNVTIGGSTNFTRLLGGPTDLTAGPTLNVTLAGGFVPNAGATFSVIPGSVSGTFSGLPNGATLGAGGAQFRVNYASVTLTAMSAPVPALSWWALVFLAMLLAAAPALAHRAGTGTS